MTKNEQTIPKNDPSEANQPESPQTIPLSPERVAVLVESLLFVADQPVSVTDLANALAVTNTQIEKGLITLTETYQTRCLQVQRKGTKVQLVTAPEATPFIEQFLGLSQSGKLSTAALEVLGVIAYKQPLTRPEVEAIRGVSCDGVLRNLLSKGLIEEVGRLDTVGHPIQYGTTFEFLKYFGISSLEQLPTLELPEEPEEDFSEDDA